MQCFNHDAPNDIYNNRRNFVKSRFWISLWSLFRSCKIHIIQACILFIIILTIFEYGNIPYFVALYIIKWFLLETFAPPATVKMIRRLLENLPRALAWKSYTKEFANNKYNIKGECAILKLLRLKPQKWFCKDLVVSFCSEELCTEITAYRNSEWQVLVDISD